MIRSYRRLLSAKSSLLWSVTWSRPNPGRGRASGHCTRRSLRRRRLSPVAPRTRRPPRWRQRRGRADPASPGRYVPACHAAKAAYGTTAACSKVRFAGFSTSFVAGAGTRPTSAACAVHLVADAEGRHRWADGFDPAREVRAGHSKRGRTDPEAVVRLGPGSPVMKCQAPRSTPAATTRTRTSCSPIEGSASSRSTETSAEPSVLGRSLSRRPPCRYAR